MKKKLSTTVDAFTLSELLVVLVIIGILVLMAMPVLTPLISRTRSLEAKQALKHLHTLEKTYFLEYSRYTSDLNKIGFEQEQLVSESETGKSNYLIELVSADQGSFIARATSVVDFDGDGIFNIWEIDENGSLREIQQD